MTETADNSDSYRCPRIDYCAFFKEHANSMPALVEKLKWRYCFRDNTRCARLWIANELGAEAVPNMLMPNQYDWAQQILCDAGKSQALYRDAFSEAVKKTS